MLRSPFILFAFALGAVSCSTAPPPRAGTVPVDRPADAIVVSGVAFPTGTRVVTWDEPPGQPGCPLRSAGYKGNGTDPDHRIGGTTQTRSSKRRT